MRVLLTLPFMLLTAPALAQSPTDAQCAATFSALSASAHAQGLSSTAFDRMAGIAAKHAGSDFTGAQDVRDLSLTDLQTRVVNCHARYDRIEADTRLAVAN